MNTGIAGHYKNVGNIFQCLIVTTMFYKEVLRTIAVPLFFYNENFVCKTYCLRLFFALSIYSLNRKNFFLYKCNINRIF